ncbi:MAG TPA: hypothetical protein VF795_00980 [Desulfuromonadaceae bacterium]
MKMVLVIGAAAVALSSRSVGAQLPPGPIGKSGCLANSIGQTYCSPPGGVIFLSSIGVALCGQGPCVVDRNGEAHCAKHPAGSAILNARGIPECEGGCAPASPSVCKKQAPRGR